MDRGPLIVLGVFILALLVTVSGLPAVDGAVHSGDELGQIGGVVVIGGFLGLLLIAGNARGCGDLFVRALILCVITLVMLAVMGPDVASFLSGTGG
jgi:hypothetical protein